MLFLLCDLLRSLVANSSFWVAACRPVPSASFRGQWPPVFGGVGRPERAFEDCGGDVLSWAAARRTQFGPGCHILGFQPSLSPAGVESPAVTDRRYREDSNARRARSELERDAAFTIHYSPFLHLTGR